MLELSGDLGFLDESADELGLFPVRFEQHLESELSSKIPVAASDYGPHAATCNLTEELITAGPPGCARHRAGRRLRLRVRLILELRVTEKYVGRAVDGLTDLRQNTPERAGKRGRQVRIRRNVGRVVGAGALDAGVGQALRADAAG